MGIESGIPMQEGWLRDQALQDGGVHGADSVRSATGKVLSLHLWLRFAALWFIVVVIGFVEGYVLLPLSRSFAWRRFLTAIVIWRVAPKWLRKLTLG